MAVENEQEVVTGSASAAASEPAGPSMHETLDAAYDKVFGPGGGPDEPVASVPDKGVPGAVKPAGEKPAVGATPAPGAAPAAPALERDPVSGKFVPKAPGTLPVKPVAPAPGAAAGAPGAPGAPPDPTVKAPQAWKALAREHWAELDKLGESGKAIKEELLRREKEVNTRLAQDAPMRQVAQDLFDVVKPYEGLIRANGHHPMETIAGLLQTAASLQTAPMQHKAAIVAQLIRGYGIDVDMLADALDGAAGPPRQPQGQSGQAYDPRVDQLVQELRARDQREADWRGQQEQAMMSEVASGYEKFAESHEFFEDVRGDMAALVRAKLDQGVVLDDEEAYNIAVALHPDLAAVSRAREEAAAATNPNGSTARAAAASGSLQPRPAVAGAGPEPEDIRGHLEQAWSKVYGGGA
jgi:hypothetical protein